LPEPTAEKESFDAVVVGSGFGGAVAAFRLSEAGLSVLVLERGVPYPPGAFPRTPRAMKENFWAPASGLLGLFEVWSFAHVTAIVSSGLGGGSLIYANVLLRKPPDTFGGWPLDAAALAPHYDNVEKVLLPHPYPGDVEPYASTPKTREFARAAAAAGLEVQRPPLAIAFAAGDGAPAPGVTLPPDDNLHGRERRTCRLCGECDVGCNEGAKHTLDFNYLSAAVRQGAHVRTCCEAVGVAPEPAGGGYAVRYLQHVSARGAHPEHLLDPTRERDRTVSGKIVVLAAGSLGSTRLLLSSRAALPGLSAQLGHRFSSNGDMFSVARDCRTGNGRRRRRRPGRRLDPSVGPVITLSASGRNGHHVWLQDAGGPATSEWLWQGLEMPADLWGMRGVVWRRVMAKLLRRRRETRLGPDLSRLLGSTRSSSSMLPLLHMGLDVPGGRLRLQGDALELDWSPAGESAPYFRASADAARRVTAELGGRLQPRRLPRGGRVPTVHPVGGCAMGTSASEGVVDTWGEVFGRRGLFVADGAVLPGPVGPNPSLTIAALADRFAARMVERAQEGA
jgi:cholesterol oxidase